MLVCATTDSRGEFNWALLDLTRKRAGELLALRRTWEQVHRNQKSLYCLEIFDNAPIWLADITGLDEATDEAAQCDWTMLPGTYGCTKASSVAAETMKVTRDGVLWSAAPKHGDGYFETRELSWKHLKRIAAGQCPFATDESK